MSMRRDAGIQVFGFSFDFLSMSHHHEQHIHCHWRKSRNCTILDYPNVYVLCITVIFVSFESNRCRTAAGWIEIVRVGVPSGALPLSVECETRKGRDRIQSPDSPGRGQRERSGGYMVESLPLIGSNYQRWLLSPIIHMTSIDSIPSPPGQHPPHSQCILQVNINPCLPYLPI